MHEILIFQWLNFLLYCWIRAYALIWGGLWYYPVVFSQLMMTGRLPIVTSGRPRAPR